MKTVTIYRIYCSRNLRSYIGSTVILQSRWTVHRSNLNLNQHHSSRLQKDYNKFGKKSFIYEVLEKCPESKRRERETHWIDAYRAARGGYNIFQDSDRPLRPGEVRNSRSPKIRQALLNPEMIARRAATLRETNKRPEIRARRSASGKKKWRDPKFRKRMTRILRENAKRRDYTVSEETRRKMSAAATIRCSTPEYRKKFGKMAKLGWEKNPLTPERSARISAQLRERWKNAEARKKQAVVMREAMIAKNRAHGATTTYLGEKIAIGELARRVCLPYGLLRDRIVESGWSAEDAVSQPIQARLALKKR